MWIFFKHLPRGVTTQEIVTITCKGAHKSWLPLHILSKPKIKRSKIIRIKDLESETLEYHAIVQVDSSELADTIVENLEGRTVNGLFLKPHRYFRRFPNRDRRSRHDSDSPVTERRLTERRRKNLITHVLETA
ncbi:MAG: hypothetical protein ABW101_07440 [Candidatus Thiodiazotropha sp.]